MRRATPPPTPADSAAPADSSAPSDSTATTDAGGDAPADGLAAAQARVDAFRQPVTELPFNEPIAMESGKKLFYVQCGVSACSEIDVGIQAAAEAAGWEYETASHQDTPETVASAFDAAIAAEPDVVMTSGNPREWFAPQLATLEEMGIPVVAWSLPEGYEPGDGIDVNLLTNDDYYFYGVLMADYAATTTETQQHPVRRPAHVPRAVDRAARLRGRDRRRPAPTAPSRSPRSPSPTSVPTCPA